MNNEKIFETVGLVFLLGVFVWMMIVTERWRNEIIRKRKK